LRRMVCFFILVAVYPFTPSSANRYYYPFTSNFVTF